MGVKASAARRQVDTDMGGTAASTAGVGRPALDAPTSIGEQLQVLDGLTLEQTGSFLDRFGQTVPW
jgi:hypothetical protein